MNADPSMQASSGCKRPHWGRLVMAALTSCCAFAAINENCVAASPEGLQLAAPTLVLDRGAGEGPAWHADYGLLFSGDGGVNRLTAAGTVEPYSRTAATNGLLFDADGRLLRCENQVGRVSRVNRDGTVEVLTDGFEGKRYNQPNDITVDSAGRIYFSDPMYGPREKVSQRDADGRAVEGVYRIDPDGNVTRVITHEVDRPNGVLVTHDQQYLFVSDNNNNTKGGARTLWRFQLSDEGAVDVLTREKIYDWGTGRGPDGMVQDAAGRIYVAAGLTQPKPPFETVDPENKAGIYVFDVSGHKLAFVPIPRDEVTNCTIGEADQKTLYITAGGTLWSLQLP